MPGFSRIPHRNMERQLCGPAGTWQLLGIEASCCIPTLVSHFDTYLNANSACLWNRHMQELPATSRSRPCCVITLTGCPLLWASKLQSIVALSSTESKLIAASNALKASINLTDIAREAQDHGVSIGGTSPNFHTRLFEDNKGAIELICAKKLCMRTKHINNKYYHFRQHVEQGDIEAVKVELEDQLADMLTKHLGSHLLCKHCKNLLGWQ
jgi:DNA-directed RNA polymerase subunit N (RpoN/RPB10)